MLLVENGEDVSSRFIFVLFVLVVVSVVVVVVGVVDDVVVVDIEVEVLKKLKSFNFEHLAS